MNYSAEETIAMHGYNIAGAAAGGALIATGFAMARHGHVAQLKPGQDLNSESTAIC